MRADALRNRERLLDAAVELILELGGPPPREAVAARAGVGIGTLYRHFPDQQALLQAVAHHVLDRTMTAGEAVLARSDDGAEALRQYLHLAVDHGLGVLNIIVPLLDRADWPERRARAEALLQGIVDLARRDGQLRDDVTVADVGFAIIRACRPLGVGLPAEDERALAHRHIDLHLDGLIRSQPSRPSASSPDRP